MLDVYGAKISATGLKHFENCPALRVFFLGYTSIDDDDMTFFRDFVGLSEITCIMLGGTAVGDDGLANLKGAVNLTQLSLYNTKITDEALKVFESHRSLTWVNVQTAEIGDEGLVNRKNCSNLRDLNIKETRVTAAGVEAFSKALPRCKIEWDGGVVEPAR